MYGIKLVSAEIADTTGGSSLEMNKEGHIFNFHHYPVHLKDTLKKSYDHEHTLIMKSEVSSTLAKLQQDQKQNEMPIEIKTYPVQQSVDLTANVIEQKNEPSNKSELRSGVLSAVSVMND